ncbi:unnamed protein product [marine sediment metagenome]|uniref:Uncharacterized protein n=1 Tax=marine sediment metagenome TaxID=412755 RepID=X1C8Q5_9ZZZZ
MKDLPITNTDLWTVGDNARHHYDENHTVEMIYSNVNIGWGINEKSNFVVPYSLHKMSKSVFRGLEEGIEIVWNYNIFET